MEGAGVLATKKECHGGGRGVLDLMDSWRERPVKGLRRCTCIKGKGTFALQQWNKSDPGIISLHGEKQFQ